MKIHSAMREKFLIIFHILIIEENGQHLHDVFFTGIKYPKTNFDSFLSFLISSLIVFL